MWADLFYVVFISVFNAYILSIRLSYSVTLPRQKMDRETRFFGDTCGDKPVGRSQLIMHLAKALHLDKPITQQDLETALLLKYKNSKVFIE